jgi:dTDP-4-dehydrorhamnose reductase
MERLLVIGAKGMLGKDLVHVLNESLPDREILAWDIDEIDIRDQGRTQRAVEDARPEMIVNLAAYTDVDGCELDPTKAFDVNAEGMKNLARAASRCGAKMLYLSTDYIFDGQKNTPYGEGDVPHPLSVYGRSKLKGEEYVRQLSEEWLIVRTQWLYGRHGKNFVRAILHLAREKKVLSIVDDQMGSPTCTMDLSRGICALIRSGARGVFHVVNGGACTWFTFAREILKLACITGVDVVPISSEELGRPAPRPGYSVLSTRKLEEEMGVSLRPWVEALEEYLRTSAS